MSIFPPTVILEIERLLDGVDDVVRKRPVQSRTWIQVAELDTHAVQRSKMA